MEGTTRKKRSENWLEEDKIILKKLVKERVKVIENKNTDSNTNSKKLAAWSDLHESFNTLARAPRNLKQLKNQWCLIKMTEKKAKFAERKERMKTGGGPSSLCKPSSPTNSDEIASWLPNELDNDSNEFDSDTPVMVIDEQSQVKIKDDYDLLEHKHKPNEKDFQDQNYSEERDFLEHDPLNRNSNEVPEPTPKKSNKGTKQGLKQKVAKNTEKELIAENEIACRRELHAIQMETEKQKLLNYRLKHEILRLTLQNMKRIK